MNTKRVSLQTGRRRNPEKHLKPVRVGQASGTSTPIRPHLPSRSKQVHPQVPRLPFYMTPTTRSRDQTGASLSNTANYTPAAYPLASIIFDYPYPRSPNAETHHDVTRTCYATPTKPSPSPLHLPLSQKTNTQMQHHHHRPSSSVTQRYVTLRNCYAYALLTFLSTSLLSFLPINITTTNDQTKPLNTARNDAINAKNTAIRSTQTLHATQHAVNRTETHRHAVFSPRPL